MRDEITLDEFKKEILADVESFLEYHKEESRLDEDMPKKMRYNEWYEGFREHLFVL